MVEYSFREAMRNSGRDDTLEIDLEIYRRLSADFG
jgi:hypothetical protein